PLTKSTSTFASSLNSFFSALAWICQGTHTPNLSAFLSLQLPLPSVYLTHGYRQCQEDCSHQRRLMARLLHRLSSCRAARRKVQGRGTCLLGLQTRTSRQTQAVQECSYRGG